MTVSPSGPFEPLPPVRIGDAEREAAAASLGEHFAAGRVDQVELDERLAAIYAARTQQEIDAQFRDLPDPRRPDPFGPPVARQRWGDQRGRGRGIPILVPLLLILVLAVVTRGAVLLPLMMIWFLVGRHRR